MTVRRTAHLPGHTVAYAAFEGCGTPLLLVHGVGSSLDTWEDLPERIAAAGHPVVALDLLGHGESGAGNGDYSLGANASVMRDLLDHLGIDRVHLVGHSLGGGVSLQFQYQYPERVESLTLISSGGLGAEVSAGLRAASLPGSEVVFRALASDRVIGWIGGSAPPRVVEKLQRLQDERRLRAFLATVRSVVGPQGQRVRATDKFDSVTDPTSVLIIWGENDSTLPMSHGVSAHEMLPGSSFVSVPGAGHHPHVDAPDLVGEAILRHVVAVENV